MSAIWGHDGETELTDRFYRGNCRDFSPELLAFDQSIVYSWHLSFCILIIYFTCAEVSRTFMRERRWGDANASAVFAYDVRPGFRLVR